MADNYLITGYWGEPHVTAENDRGIHAGIFGAGRFVLSVGKQFAAEYIGNNTVRIYDGKLMDNGAAAGIPAGEYIDLTIANAGHGMSRNDLIVFEYSRDASTLVETGSFKVVQGTEAVGTATDPELTQADLLSGTASLDQMAIWRVAVTATTISPPVMVADVKTLIGTEYVDKKVDGQFVPLSGGTMTGALGTTRVTIDEGSGNNPRAIFNHGGTQLGIHYVRTTDAKNVFAQYLGDVVERFALPAVTNASGDTTYNILTTKTVKYGTDDPETAVGKAGTAGRIYFKKVT